MKIRELVSLRITLPKKQKERDGGVWNLEKNTTLRESVDECIYTGKEVFKPQPGGMLYHVRPEYPMIESAMQQPENQALMKVSIVAYMTSLHLGVERE
jgi:hypothetical protein